MRRRPCGGAAVGLALVLLGTAPVAGGATGDEASVDAQFAAFGPAQLDLLPGTTVTWHNVSDRTHTVTADDAAFPPGELAAGAAYSVRLDAVGVHPYHCTIHAGMTGEIDVQRVTLAALPGTAVPTGEPVTFTGRTADPSVPVRVERVVGTGFQAVATALPAPDGTWSATVHAAGTGDYRAASDLGASQTRRLLVSERRVRLRATRRGAQVTVTPPLPYGRVVLQRLRRERFGWWPERTTRLDYVSQATFSVPRPARVRVLLVDRDGWTPLASSRVLVLRTGRSSRGARPRRWRGAAAPGPAGS